MDALGTSRSRFTADLIPGLTTAAVVVPKALAYATIAGLPVQAGLFAAMVPMVVYAALGTSRLLSVSTSCLSARACFDSGSSPTSFRNRC
jgi:SulP family sulfate permease